MLGPDRVHEVLLKADPMEGLWLTAADYFTRTRDPAPLTADDIFDLERPLGEGHKLYELLPRVAPSDRTPGELARLLELGEFDTLVHSIVLGLVPQSPWLADRNASRWLSVTLRRSVDRVRGLCALDFQALWNEFLVCAERWEPFAAGSPFKTADYLAWFHAFDMRREELTVALGTHGTRAGAAACDLLADPPARGTDSRHCAAALLAQCPCSEALEPVLQLLGAAECGDLQRACVGALSCIGTVEVIKRAAESYRQTGDRRLIDVIGRMREPAVERTLLELLRESSDALERATIVEALASAFPTQGFEEMLDVTLAPEYVRLNDDGLLLEGVLDAARVAGYRCPRLPSAYALLGVLYPPRQGLRSVTLIA